MTTEREALDNFLQTSRAEREAYITRTNQIVGISAFTFGLACVGLKLSALYALLCLLFTVLVWSDGLKKLTAHFSALRRARDPDAAWWAMLWRMRVSMVGSLFLACVALGIILP